MWITVFYAHLKPRIVSTKKLQGRTGACSHTLHVYFSLRLIVPFIRDSQSLKTRWSMIRALRSCAEQQKQLDEIHAELVTRYSAGETARALAAEHGLHHQTVRAVLVRAGASVRVRQRLSQSDVDEIVRLHEAGLTTTEISERFGVYASTIGRTLKKLGIELRAPGWRRAGEQS